MKLKERKKVNEKTINNAAVVSISLLAIIHRHLYTETHTDTYIFSPN